MEGLRRRWLAALGACLLQVGGAPAVVAGEGVRIAGMAHYPVAGQGAGPGPGVLAVIEAAPLRSLWPRDVGIPRTSGEARATRP